MVSRGKQIFVSYSRRSQSSARRNRRQGGTREILGTIVHYTHKPRGSVFVCSNYMWTNRISYAIVVFHRDYLFVRGCRHYATPWSRNTRFIRLIVSETRTRVVSLSGHHAQCKS